MKTLRIVLVLALVSVFSAGTLSFFELLAEKRIAENEKREIEESIFTIAPQTEKIEEVKDYYKLFDREGNLLGYVFLAEGQGYQGPVKILFALKPNLEELLGIEIISHQETPGLGAKIDSEEFKQQFRRLKVLPKIEYLKKKPSLPNQIQAITGATVSSRSVVNILNKKIEQIRRELKKR
ncbi:MAG TPA: FMN-binding protein [Candidatus Omnitrophica bacterium]|nr:MAG: hypothetical protein DRP61_04720 [Candidatus Omnitrophota bacterium]RKY35369.1 MAG: hypothetical protein DRP69_01825 [Candidatus Omnitrophota bacterium]RKY44265.1 MAG: hypothetical protein DRP80_02750 [Candidatus Omnitrophota bacterium]HEC69886.1 FMN-binding protein [Candidatus Omnitrophota bacterium]